MSTSVGRLAARSGGVMFLKFSGTPLRKYHLRQDERIAVLEFVAGPTAMAVDGCL